MKIIFDFNIFDIFFQDGLHRLKQMANSKYRHNIAYAIKICSLIIGKSFTVKATKNKQINKKLATISLTKKYRSKKNQTLLLSCLMIHSTRPLWPFLAIFAQKNICCSHQKRATPWFHEKPPHKIRLYICVPKVTKKAQATVKKWWNRTEKIQATKIYTINSCLINPLHFNKFCLDFKPKNKIKNTYVYLYICRPFWNSTCTLFFFSFYYIIIFSNPTFLEKPYK